MPKEVMVQRAKGEAGSVLSRVSNMLNTWWWWASNWKDPGGHCSARASSERIGLETCI